MFHYYYFNYYAAFGKWPLTASEPSARLNVTVLATNASNLARVATTSFAEPELNDDSTRETQKRKNSYRTSSVTL